MDLEKIKALVEIIETSGLTEFSYKDEDVEIEMSKLDNVPPAPPAPMPMPMPMMPMQMMPQQAAAPAPAAAEPEAEESELICSPIVGTFYSAAAPDVPAYVRVGDYVKAGDTVCILEAMKLMNEIECEFDCEIEAVLVSNEQKVEYGQPLFRVKRL